MKKFVVSCLAVALMSGFAFAGVFQQGDGSKGDINVRLGLDLLGFVSMKQIDNSWILAENGDTKHSDNSKIGVSFSAEYLYPVLPVLKAGAGIGYLLPRKMISPEYGVHEDVDMSASYIPIYATAQPNPIKKYPEVFFKGNIGYSFFNSGDWDKDITKFFNEIYWTTDDDVVKITDKGGLYLALSAGYEFNFGLILDLSYSYYQASCDVKDSWNGGDSSGSADFSYSVVGISAGYKFKL